MFEILANLIYNIHTDCFYMFYYNFFNEPSKVSIIYSTLNAIEIIHHASISLIQYHENCIFQFYKLFVINIKGYSNA